MIDLQPNAGAEGDSVTLSGERLTSPGGTTRVHLQDLEAEVERATETSVTFRIPAGARTAPVLVATAEGDGVGPVLHVTSSQAVPTAISGQSASRFLRPHPFPALLVEVDFAGRFPPSASALDLLARRLLERTYKPGGISILLDDVLPAGEEVWTYAEVVRQASRHRDHYAGPTSFVLYLHYLDGESELSTEGQRVLGFGISGEELAIFAEGIDRSTPPPLTPALLERPVLVHELGHLLGLVNDGTPMVTFHEDLLHPRHDTEEDCVMYHRIKGLCPGFLPVITSDAVVILV